METKTEDSAATVTGTDLVVAKGTSLEKIFKNGDAFALMIKKIEDQTREEAKKLDPTTKKGRDALVSLAFTVSKSKAQLDKDGKALTEKQRAEIDLVNASRKAAEQRLSSLRDEVRKPVTDWEAAEEKRHADMKEAMTAFNLEHVTFLDSPEDIQARIDLIKAIEVDETWQEYEEPAKGAQLHAIAKYERDHGLAVTRLAEQAELEELRAMRAAQLIKDQEAAEAKAEADRVEAERLEAEAQAERDRIAAEAQAEADRIEAERQAEVERLAAIAAERAEEERVAQHNRDVEAAREQAAQVERNRIAKEMDDVAAELAKREADKEHVNRIKSDIHGAVMDLISAVKADPDAKAGSLATKLAESLMAGEIPHTKVQM